MTRANKATKLPSPVLYLSTYAVDGVRHWTLIRNTMPAMATRTDDRAEADARLLYASHREDFMVWKDGRKEHTLPQEPPIWDGDAGEFMGLPVLNKAMQDAWRKAEREHRGVNA